MLLQLPELPGTWFFTWMVPAALADSWPGIGTLPLNTTHRRYGLSPDRTASYPLLAARKPTVAGYRRNDTEDMALTSARWSTAPWFCAASESHPGLAPPHATCVANLVPAECGGRRTIHSSGKVLLFFSLGISQLVVCYRTMRLKKEKEYWDAP